jgi:1-acyl-sn-glycerol-3-phosphate acyltransferase
MSDTSSATAEHSGPMREQVYEDPRPAEYFTSFHQRARTKEPDFGVYGTIHVAMYFLGVPFFQIQVIGLENVPDHGPVILAPNHYSYMDHFLMAVWLRRQVRFVAKSQMFKRPLQFIYSHGGVIPVRRGRHDEEWFITAKTILDGCERSGGLIVMYCEGGRSRSGKIAEKAKRGIGRLALETGAQVVPVAIKGSNNLRNWRKPKKMGLPKITVAFGEPFAYDIEAAPPRERQQKVADVVLTEIRTLYLHTERRPGWFGDWLVQGRRILAYKLREKLG